MDGLVTVGWTVTLLDIVFILIIGLDCGFIRNLIPVNSELDYGVISV